MLPKIHPEIPPAWLSLSVNRGYAILGQLQACAAYTAWRWLQQREYAAVHFEGGNGLAAHVLDACRQGWPDQHGPIHVHYRKPPPWLNECGYIQFHNMAEAEAWCLERRVSPVMAAACMRIRPCKQCSVTLLSMNRIAQPARTRQTGRHPWSAYASPTTTGRRC